MIPDDKVIAFKNAKTVWVEHRGDWVEAEPLSIDLKSTDSFLVKFTGPNNYATFTTFKLEKPQDKPNDWEICLVWDRLSDEDEEYKNMCFYNPNDKRFYSSPQDHGFEYKHCEPTGIFIPEKFRKGMK